MAIKSFKEIIENKGYRISSKDRDIFEQGNLQSFFGFSESDMIEFIMYDANDNQLPQGELGNLVRYIPLNSENIKDYFLIADGTEFQLFNFPNEYFIDIERLIRDAGYGNGIFKTQITLLNKRVGYDSSNEKLWITEISPSRTEVKLLPIRNKVSKQTDLLTRFNIMATESSFRDDIIPYINSFIESINPTNVTGFIKKTYGEKWYNKFIAEFGISGLESVSTEIYNSLKDSIIKEFTNRVSSPFDVNYGEKKTTKPPLQLSKEDVYKITQINLIKIIDKYLPERTIQSDTQTSNTFDDSADGLYNVVKTRESDITINPQVPQKIITKKKESVKADNNLEKEIEKEVPEEKSTPKFTKPNPTKSKKRGRSNQTVDTNDTYTQSRTSGYGRLRNSNQSSIINSDTR